MASHVLHFFEPNLCHGAEVLSRVAVLDDCVSGESCPQCFYHQGLDPYSSLDRKSLSRDGSLYSSKGHALS